MAFSAPAAGVITQTGRDLTYTGLAGNAGVTRTVDDGITYYDFGTNRLYVQGTLFHDPEKEVVIFHHDALDTTFQPCLYINRTATDWGNNSAWSLAADGNLTFTRTGHTFLVGDAVEIRSTATGGASTANNLNNIVFRVIAVNGSNVTIDTNKDVPIPASNGQSILRACYNYGNETTLYGRTRYSTGTGIYITGTSPTNWQEEGGGISISLDGLLWARGGTIVTHRPNVLGFVNINSLSIFGTRTLDTRSMGEGVVRNFEITNADIANFRSVKEKGFILKSSGLVETVSEPYFEIELRNFDASKNVNDYDIGHSQSGTYCHRDWIITNSANGSNVRALWRQTTGNTSQLGSAIVKKEVSIKTVDVTNTAISAVKIYCVDNPSPYAKNVTFSDPISGTYFAPTLSLGVLNPNGSVTYNYTVPITYAYTTDLSGNTPTFKVTTATQFLEYNTNNPAALASNGGPYAIPSFNSTWRETDNLAPAYSDWDTTRFGGFYKVDRRSVSNTSADDFVFKFCSYNHALAFTSQFLKGFDVLQVNWVLFNDASITQTNKTIVDAYTTIDTPEKFYDRAKSYLYDNYAGQTSTLVTRNGNVINLGSYNVVIDTLAASAFAFDGSTFTLKADNFVGTLQTTGTLTLLNGAFNTDPRYIALTLNGASIAIYDNEGNFRYYTNTDQNITLPLSSTGVWTYKYAKYGHKLGQGSFTVNGGIVNVSPISIEDVYVSETFAYNASAYSGFDTTQKIYNYLSYYTTTSAGLNFSSFYSYGATLNVESNNIILFDSALSPFSYDGTTFVLSSLNLSGAAITTTGTIGLSGNSIVSDIILTSEILDQTPSNLTNVTINGILKYNTDSPATVTYTNSTVNEVVNDGTGIVLIQRINSSINNATDPQIDDYAPTIINVTPNGSSVAIYNNIGTREYFITSNSTVVLPSNATGTWTYKVAKYGYELVLGSFVVNSSTGGTVDINPNYVPDTFITEQDATIVAAYTDLNSTARIHDYISYIRTTSAGIDYGTLHTQSFGTLTFNHDLALDSDAVTIFDYSGGVITLKSSAITDNIIYFVVGDFIQLNSNTISDGVKIRANNLDSEFYFANVDSLVFFPTENDRNNNTNPGPTITSETIYRFLYGATVSGVTFSGNIYIRVTVAGTTLLNTTALNQGSNTIDFGTTGNIQVIINNQKVINAGVQKASKLIPHSTNI